jgi:hypothetical protein
VTGKGNEQQPEIAQCRFTTDHRSASLGARCIVLSFIKGTTIDGLSAESFRAIDH